MLALEQSLPLTERAALDEHLAQCADCRLEWQRLQALERLLRDAAPLRPPSGFAGRTMARLDRDRSVRRVVLGGFSFAAAGAFVALLPLLPLLVNLPGLVGGLPAFSRTLGVVAVRLLYAAASLYDSLRLSFEAVALCFLPVAFCGLILTLVAGLFWLGLVCQLRPAAHLPRS